MTKNVAKSIRGHPSTQGNDLMGNFANLQSSGAQGRIHSPPLFAVGNDPCASDPALATNPATIGPECQPSTASSIVSGQGNQDSVPLVSRILFDSKKDDTTSSNAKGKDPPKGIKERVPKRPKNASRKTNTSNSKDTDGNNTQEQSAKKKRKSYRNSTPTKRYSP